MLQRQRIGDGHVPGNMRQDYWIFWRDGVELLAIGEPFFRPERVVPPPPSDPLDFLIVRNCLSYTPLHFFRRRDASQFDRKRGCASTTQVYVCVIEAGHHKFVMQGNRCCSLLAAAAIEQHVSRFSDAGDFSIGSGHGFGPWTRRIVGVNPPVSVENGLARSLLGNGSLRQRGGGAQRGPQS